MVNIANHLPFYNYTIIISLLQKNIAIHLFVQTPCYQRHYSWYNQLPEAQFKYVLLANRPNI